MVVVGFGVGSLWAGVWAVELVWLWCCCGLVCVFAVVDLRAVCVAASVGRGELVWRLAVGLPLWSTRVGGLVACVCTAVRLWLGCWRVSVGVLCVVG